jgi:uncharacterized protein YprB with RNaseH-like and TPR domain
MPDFAKDLSRLRAQKSPQRDLFVSENPVVSIGQQLQFLKSRVTSTIADCLNLRPAILPDGIEQTTPYGAHFQRCLSYDAEHYHGRVRLGRFLCSDLELLVKVMRHEVRVPARDAIVFLDTETTGIQGGTGTCPFLVGLGYFDGEGWTIEQFFIRDFDEEQSMLYALQQRLSRFQLVVTYNGASFDIPLLESRFVLARLDNSFETMTHLDMLTSSRRLWRNGYGSCRLASLEARVATFMRGPDVPGAAIPRAYFDYLRGKYSPVIRGVFTHNAHDIASLAALTVCACDSITLPPAAFDEPLNVFSIAKVFEHTTEWKKAVAFYDRAIQGGLPAPQARKAKESLVGLYRRSGEHERSLSYCRQLMAEDEFSFVAYEGAAMYYERIDRNSRQALEIVEAGLSRLDDNPRSRRWRTGLQTRRERLRQITFP